MTMKADIEALRAWTSTHDKAHVADKELLTLLLEELSDHNTNHHGRASTIKQGGWIAAALTLLYGASEAIRRIFL